MLTRSIVGGALASVGVTALLSPALFLVLAMAVLMAIIGRVFDHATPLTEYVYEIVPALVAVAMSSLAAGYVAGAMSGVERGRHGSAAALLGFVLALVLGLSLGILNVDLLGASIAIASIAAIPIVVAFGRLGAAVTPQTVAARVPKPIALPAPVRRPRQLLPAVGQKGGERADDVS